MCDYLCMRKRGAGGNSASGAAILIVIVAVIFLLYILMLPPEDRADLLGEDNRSNSEEITSSGFNKTLLKENIGRLDYLRSDYRERDLPSFRIYSQKEGTILKTLNSVYVKNAIGDKKYYNVTFDIAERLTSEVKLSFNVKRARGRLELYLNGVEIFNGELGKGSPSPIPLPSEALDSENTLVFKVSSPGFAFWSTNEYLLEDVMITGDVLDVSNSKSRQFFYLSDIEVLNLDEIRLKFYPDCDSRSVGPLIINLNGEEAFFGVADCGVYRTVTLDKNSIYEDKNELEFIATEGSYLIDRVSIRTELEELVYPVYYFDLDEDLFDGDDFDDSYNVTLRLRFVNHDDKRLEYLINGRRKQINTDEIEYTTLLNDYVLPEANSLELVPKSIVDISVLRVTLDEEE